MMFGEPVADIAQPIHVARQIDAVAQRRGGLGARGDNGEVEDGKRDHRVKLVRRGETTKAPAAQIWPAKASRKAPHILWLWAEWYLFRNLVMLPTNHLLGLLHNLCNKIRYLILI